MVYAKNLYRSNRQNHQLDWQSGRASVLHHDAIDLRGGGCTALFSC